MDIGHYPFSHSLDGLHPLLLSHEQVGRQLTEGELGTILERDYHLVAEAPGCTPSFLPSPGLRQWRYARFP